MVFKDKRFRSLSIVLLVILTNACARRSVSRSFADLERQTGQIVYVIDENSEETRGSVVEVTESALLLEVDGGSQQIARDGVRMVQRDDSLRNGFLIGLGLGAGYAVFADPSGDEVNVGRRLLSVGIMGLVGAGIDALFVNRDLIYRAPD